MDAEPNIPVRGGMELLMEGVRCLDEMRSAQSKLPEATPLAVSDSPS